MILERDLGLEISRATLDGWVLKVGELPGPDGRGNEARIDQRKLHSGG